MIHLDKIGWLFIYIFAFGISDYIVKKYFKTDIKYIVYYLSLGFIGLFLLTSPPISTF